MDGPSEAGRLTDDDLITMADRRTAADEDLARAIGPLSDGMPEFLSFRAVVRNGCGDFRYGKRHGNGPFPPTYFASGL
jgi:hypothetical protein